MAKADHYMHKEGQKGFIETSLLMAPLLIAFFWMGYLTLSIQGPEIGTGLSPVKLDSLMNALLAFILLYSAILCGIFYHMKKSAKKQKK